MIGGYLLFCIHELQIPLAIEPAKWTMQCGMGKDLFPYLKVPLDVRCLGMKLNHWNIISANLPKIHNSEHFLFLLCMNFMSISCLFWVKSQHLAYSSDLISFPGTSHPRALWDMETSLYHANDAIDALNGVFTILSVQVRQQWGCKQTK